MKFLKGFGKFILYIVRMVLVMVLVITGILYQIRNITAEFISEEQIKKSIESVNILDLFKDEEGNELEAVTQVKQQLVDAGLPVETVEGFINSEPIKQITTDATMLVIDYVFYDKKIETPTIDREQILTFIQENMSLIVTELQEHNVPNSELLTAEKQQEVINKIEEQMPIIEEQIQEITSTLEEAIKGTEEYEQVEEYKAQVDQVLSTIRFIYGEQVTMIFIVIFAVCIIGIILCSVSWYKFLKWLGISGISCGATLYSISFMIPMLHQYTNQIPYMFQNLFTLMVNDSTNLFISKSIPCFIIGIIFIILNIIIWYILEKKEDKKIDL